jgi:hypothetical protein
METLELLHVSQLPIIPAIYDSVLIQSNILTIMMSCYNLIPFFLPQPRHLHSMVLEWVQWECWVLALLLLFLDL